MSDTATNNEICGVNPQWEIKSHPSDLSTVMAQAEVRFIGNFKECREFVELNKPTPSSSEKLETKMAESFIREKIPTVTNWSNKEGQAIIEVMEEYADLKMLPVLAERDKIINGKDETIGSLEGLINTLETKCDESKNQNARQAKLIEEKDKEIEELRAEIKVLKS